MNTGLSVDLSRRHKYYLRALAEQRETSVSDIVRTLIDLSLYNPKLTAKLFNMAALADICREYRYNFNE